MNKKHVLILVCLWAVLTAFAWFSPAEAMSDSERRPLKQFPEMTLQKLLNGSFMKDFESYSLDQFPLRDGFRRVKSLFHYSVLGQKDNNGIYLEGGYAAGQEYPLDQDSLNHALDRFQRIYDRYLEDSRVYLAVVPDKGYYLAEEAGQLSLDYEALFSAIQTGMPWAQYIDLTDTLSLEDYYRTDTHWRQEKLTDTAVKICETLGAAAPREEDFTPIALERPFYGVYYGQAALPMKPETLYLMESDLLNSCTVYDHETGKTGSVYDLSKLDSRDLYDVYLSGARALLTIENPAAETDRELILFRDSYGSSLAPLLIQGYSKITLVDIRYVSSELLDRFIDFPGKDVLFLYGSLILNNSSSLK